MSLFEVLPELRRDGRFMRCVTAWERLPARPARTTGWPGTIDARLVEACREQGVEQPYIHQAEAFEATLTGEHIVLATPTASGKTLAYNLPVLHVLLREPQACALYVFPTKALAHDQIANLDAQLAQLHPYGQFIVVRPFDGDTPSAQRSAIRREARLLVTNPDMLHTGILPHHTRWARFFGNLRYVVVDELHTYRGVFGGHVANVLRRLRRICRFYGSAPQFIGASATIANPCQLAERLFEAPIRVVDQDGAPQGEKHFLFYNPPLVDAQLGIRQSTILVARDISARFLGAGVQTIVFARARLTTEVLLGYLRDSIAEIGREPHAVRGYRGGYLAHERREIERGLRAGAVRAVVATNALELGVDIGQLDACVMAGYPGTIASAWQQAGRAGRRAGLSVAVLVASAAPIDQYLVTHPRYFFGQTVEHALLDPDNLVVLANHIACAAYELPFEANESFGGFAGTDQFLDVLAAEGTLYRRDGTYTWIGEGYPAAGLSLRTSAPNNVVIQDVGSSPPQVIGQVDRPSAPAMVYEGAVYLHEGAAYVVDVLDWETGIAQVKSADLDYYTRATSTTEVRVISITSTRATERVSHAWGEVLVRSRVTGYRRIKRYTHEVLAWAPLDLPEQEFHTIGTWLALSEELTEQLQEAGVLLPPIDYGPDWPAQREAARVRDGCECRQCGAPERDGHQHDVHHLTPFRAFGYVPGVNDFHRIANRLENLITLCPTCHRRLERLQGTQSALSGLAHLLQNLAPLHLMCDPSDLGSVVQARAPETCLPTVTIYDRAPGGAGLSARLYEVQGELLRAALDVVAQCPCIDGCPGCVGPGGDDIGLRAKVLTRQLLEALLSVEPLTAGLRGAESED
jgi:DEAD/DEAH box helicase domain-containing protein